MQLRTLSLALLFACFGTVFAAERSRDGLIALYDFTDTDRQTVADRSGVSPALDLVISKPDQVQRGKGVLAITGNTLIHTPGPATKIIDAIKVANAITIEAWVEPIKLD